MGGLVFSGPAGSGKSALLKVRNFLGAGRWAQRLLSASFRNAMSRRRRCRELNLKSAAMTTVFSGPLVEQPARLPHAVARSACGAQTRRVSAFDAQLRGGESSGVRRFRCARAIVAVFSKTLSFHGGNEAVRCVEGKLRYMVVRMSAWRRSPFCLYPIAPPSFAPSCRWV